MMAWLARALPNPPCAGPTCLPAIALAVFPASVASARVVPPSPLPTSPVLLVGAPATTNPAHVLPPLARRDPPLHPASLRAPCRWPFPPNRAPSIPRRVRHSRLPYTSKPRPSQTGSLPNAPGAAQFPFCPRPWAQSSKYSSAAHPRQFPVEASAFVRDSATLPLPRVSPQLGPRCICPVPPQFLVASCHPTPVAPFPGRLAGQPHCCRAPA